MKILVLILITMAGLASCKKNRNGSSLSYRIIDYDDSACYASREFKGDPSMLCDGEKRAWTDYSEAINGGSLFPTVKKQYEFLSQNPGFLSHGDGYRKILESGRTYFETRVTYPDRNISCNQQDMITIDTVFCNYGILVNKLVKMEEVRAQILSPGANRKSEALRRIFAEAAATAHLKVNALVDSQLSSADTIQNRKLANDKTNHIYSYMPITIHQNALTMEPEEITNKIGATISEIGKKLEELNSISDGISTLNTREKDLEADQLRNRAQNIQFEQEGTHFDIDVAEQREKIQSIEAEIGRMQSIIKGINQHKDNSIEALYTNSNDQYFKPEQTVMIKLRDIIREDQKNRQTKFDIEFEEASGTVLIDATRADTEYSANGIYKVLQEKIDTVGKILERQRDLTDVTRTIIGIGDGEGYSTSNKREQRNTDMECLREHLNHKADAGPLWRVNRSGGKCFDPKARGFVDIAPLYYLFNNGTDGDVEEDPTQFGQEFTIENAKLRKLLSVIVLYNKDMITDFRKALDDNFKKVLEGEEVDEEIAEDFKEELDRQNAISFTITGNKPFTINVKTAPGTSAARTDIVAVPSEVTEMISWFRSKLYKFDKGKQRKHPQLKDYFSKTADKEDDKFGPEDCMGYCERLVSLVLSLHLSLLEDLAAYEDLYNALIQLPAKGENVAAALTSYDGYKIYSTYSTAHSTGWSKETRTTRVNSKGPSDLQRFASTGLDIAAQNNASKGDMGGYGAAMVGKALMDNRSSVRNSTTNINTTYERVDNIDTSVMNATYDYNHPHSKYPKYPLGSLVAELYCFEDVGSDRRLSEFMGEELIGRGRKLIQKPNCAEGKKAGILLIINDAPFVKSDAKAAKCQSKEQRVNNSQKCKGGAEEGSITYQFVQTPEDAYQHLDAIRDLLNSEKLSELASAANPRAAALTLITQKLNKEEIDPALQQNLELFWGPIVDQKILENRIRIEQQRILAHKRTIQSYGRYMAIVKEKKKALNGQIEHTEERISSNEEMLNNRIVSYINAYGYGLSEKLRDYVNYRKVLVQSLMLNGCTPFRYTPGNQSSESKLSRNVAKALTHIEEVGEIRSKLIFDLTPEGIAEFLSENKDKLMRIIDESSFYRALEVDVSTSDDFSCQESVVETWKATPTQQPAWIDNDPVHNWHTFQWTYGNDGLRDEFRDGRLVKALGYQVLTAADTISIIAPEATSLTSWRASERSHHMVSTPWDQTPIVMTPSTGQPNWVRDGVSGRTLSGEWLISISGNKSIQIKFFTLRDTHGMNELGRLYN